MDEQTILSELSSMRDSMSDTRSEVLSEIRSLRTDVNSFSTSTVQRLSAVETQVNGITKLLLGNGQPGKLTILETRIDKLESWRWYIAGMAVACFGIAPLVLHLVA